MKQFDVEKAISRLRSAQVFGSEQVVTTGTLLDVLEAGLVSLETNNDCPAPTKPCGCLVGHECAGDKKDTIEIDRAVAEKWTELFDSKPALSGFLYDEIKQALSEVRT